MPHDFKQRASDLLYYGAHRDSFEIFLFPLKIVLFPGALLPLKVFEPRYMEMVSACIKDQKPFGACLILEGEETSKPAKHVKTGCLAKIIEWDMQQLGVLNIQVLGTERFYIEDTRIEPNGLIIARAVNITPESAQPVPASFHGCTILLRRLIEHLGEKRFMLPLKYDDAVWVGYRLAELLPLKLSVRQSMLEMNDSQVRIEILYHFLAQQGLLA